MNLNQKIIKPKIGLLELARSLGNVSAACRTMGYSRDSYYRFQELLLRLTLFGIICPILNAYYEKLFDIKYLASLELRHGSAQLNI